MINCKKHKQKQTMEIGLVKYCILDIYLMHPFKITMT